MPLLTSTSEPRLSVSREPVRASYPQSEAHVLPWHDRTADRRSGTCARDAQRTDMVKRRKVGIQPCLGSGAR